MTTQIAPLQKVIQTLLEVDAVRNITETSPKGAETKIGQKIRPDACRIKDTPPFIVLEVADEDTLPDLDGVNGDGTAQMLVICVGAKRETTVEIANAVDTILNNYRGTVAGTQIQHCLRRGPARGYEPPQDDGDESHGFYISLRYDVMFTAGVT
ncbi:hypothetical protein [Planctomyces sp. SH-PL14]|uniref:hypothetical protein n=1 Tax=Planctomyces sp. SH-PL14 TaxID=1632864 RepID=UPI00078B6029|nr:hypothetical protein [Planctomyces sp. SH-PL14]AMV20411.1 hypothetical protein VT03_21110 [Planctomyces sp. SH-PL14]